MVNLSYCHVRAAKGSLCGLKISKRMALNGKCLQPSFDGSIDLVLFDSDKWASRHSLKNISLTLFCRVQQ